MSDNLRREAEDLIEHVLQALEGGAPAGDGELQLRLEIARVLLYADVVASVDVLVDELVRSLRRGTCQWG